MGVSLDVGGTRATCRSLQAWPRLLLVATLVALVGGLAVQWPGADAGDEPGVTEAPGWLGVLFRNPSRRDRVLLGEEFPGGAKVRAVAAGSPAESAGLKPGDFIVAVGGQPVAGAEALARVLPTLRPDVAVDVRVLRGGVFRDLQATPLVKDSRALALTILRRSLDWLVAHQLEDGSWPDLQRAQPVASAPVAAMVLHALAGAPSSLRSRESMVAGTGRALDFLRGRTDERGAVLEPDRASAYKNYATALTLTALLDLDDEAHQGWVERLRAHLLEAQIEDQEGFSRLDYQYGAWNYYEVDKRNHVRADISVCAYVVDALARAQVDADSRTVKLARRFLFKCQGVREGADEATQALLDGGFSFTPRESKAGMEVLENDDVVYPSYGSTTADGLRTLLHLGLASDHPRVKAAVDWLRQHYTLHRNPGFPKDAAVRYDQAILYYYYHSLARALEKLGENPFLTEGGARPRRWDRELIDTLAFRQRGDGSFSNPEPTMGEQEPVLATALACLTLESCLRAADAVGD